MQLFSVGDVAARLGVTASTVRMWGERYGITASAQTPGGHRRYTEADLALLHQMHDAVIAGAAPAEAAAAVQGRTAQTRDGRPGGPGGSVLAVPGGGAAVRGLARAASRLDEIAVEDTVFDALRTDGVLAAWDGLIRPVLVSSGEHWQRTGSGIEIEHMLTQAVTTAFTRYGGTLPEPPQERPTLLAGGPRDEHILPLYALRAALLERGVPARLLGPRTPVVSLAAAARRTRAAAAFIWISATDSDVPEGLPLLRAAHRRLAVLGGGPGWRGVESDGVTVCTGIEDAATALSAIWLDGRPR